MAPWLWLCVVLVLFDGQRPIGPYPDFSGRWALMKQDRVESGVDEVLEIRQSTAPWFSNLTVKRTSRSGTRFEDHMIGVHGGMVQGLPPAGEPLSPFEQVRFSTSWNGNTLVFNRRTILAPNPDTAPYRETEESWSLDSRGRLLVALTERGSAIETRTVYRTYRRIAPIPSDGTRYFKEDRGTSALYLALKTNGAYQLVSRELSGVWLREVGGWNRMGERIELTPRQQGKTPYARRQLVRRGRAVLVSDEEKTEGFREIDKATHDRETREPYRRRN